MAESKPQFPWPAGKRAAVSLSFDDARLSQIDRGMAVFDAHGVKATFYVAPGGVTARLDGWKRAAANGHETANHTVHHPCSGNFAWSRHKALEDYTIERMEREILDANRFVEEQLGVTPVTFAYPCGQTYVGRGRNTVSYVPLIAEHFLVGRAASSEIHNDPAFCDLAQAACLGSDGRSFEQLKAMVDRAVADGGWLILCGHEIGDGGFQTTQVPALEALCRYCEEPANGVWIDTVEAIGKFVAQRQGMVHDA